ncbi:hypothetical protein BY998_1476 [Methylobacterium sp. B4]|nr:hypothetical protein BY998_1476 [Methylobacterium sp. B4]
MLNIMVRMAAAAAECALVTSLVSFGRTRILECAHQHPPAPGIVDIHQPIGPIRTWRPVHERPRDPIGLWPKLT